MNGTPHKIEHDYYPASWIVYTDQGIRASSDYINGDFNKCLVDLKTSAPRLLTRMMIFGAWGAPTIIHHASLPQSLSHLRLLNYTIHIFSPGSLPPALTHLEIHGEHDTFMGNPVADIPHGCLPATLTHLIMRFTRHTFSPGSLPANLTHLVLQWSASDTVDHQITPGSLPPTLTHLKLISNHTIVAGMIPSSVTHLQLVGSFNQEIHPGALPSGIVHLTFGHFFDQPLQVGSLPSQLKTLRFGPPFRSQAPPYIDAYHYEDEDVTFTVNPARFNQPIPPLVLPANLTSLSFGSGFNQPLLEHSLPSSLSHLAFGVTFNQPLQPHILPQSLTHLAFDSQDSEFNQPIGLGVLPSGLTHLDLGDSFNHPLDTLTLPNTLQHIQLGQDYRQSNVPLHSLPSLTHLTINDVSQLRDLPPTVTHLSTGYLFDSPIQPGSIPSTVTHLTFGYKFGFSAYLKTGCIPDSVTNLRLGERFKQDLSTNRIIARSVTHLTLPTTYMNDSKRSITTGPKDGFSLNKSPFPSVTNVTFSSMQGLYRSYYNPYPSKLYDHLALFKRVNVQFHQPFNYHDDIDTEMMSSLCLEKIDKSTVIWVNRGPPE
eukprot:gene15294-18108_t